MRTQESTTNVVHFPGTEETPTTTAVEAEDSDREPQTDAKRMAYFNKSKRRIEGLVSRIVNYDYDDEVLALIALIDMIAYEKEFCRRDEIAAIAMTKAYTFTIDFSTKSEAFRNKARRLK